MLIMQVTTFLLQMRPDDSRSRNRMIPLGSIRSDIVAASRFFRVLFVSPKPCIFNVFVGRYCVGRLCHRVISHIYRIIERLWIVLSFALSAIDRLAELSKNLA